MTWKKLNTGDVGTPTKFGGNDTDKIDDLFSGVDVDDVDINADISFRYDRAQTRNSVNSFGHKHRSLATAARTVTYPDEDVSFISPSSITTFTGKTASAEANTLAFLGGPVSTWSIYFSGTTVNARNNKTGVIVYNDTGGDVDAILTSIINAISPVGSPTVIEFGEGEFGLAAGFTAINSTKVGNIKIKGQGAGITNIVLRNGTIRGFLIAGALDATPRNLTVNTIEAFNTVSMSVANAATFAAGDYVLLKSAKIWGAPATSAVAFQGEIHKVKATGSGLVTFQESIMDTYTTANTASLTKINMLRNITIEDLTIRPVSSGYSGQTNALLECNYIDNLQLTKVEVADSTIASANGIYMKNIINSDLDVIATQSGNYPFVELPTTGQYGCYIGLACQHVRLHIVGRGRFRHLVSGGGVAPGNAGITRDLIVSGSAETGMRGAFDFHADADGVTFQNCNISVIGTTNDTTNLCGGISSRAKSTVIVNNNIRMATYFGISLNELANSTVIANNTIQQMRKLDDGSGATSIRLNPDITGTVISGNTFKDNDGATTAILADSGNHDTVISNNTFIDSGQIQFTAANDCVITGNRFNNGASFRAIRMIGASDFWVITGNNARGCATSLFVGTGNVRANNINL